MYKLPVLEMDKKLSQLVFVHPFINVVLSI